MVLLSAHIPADFVVRLRSVGCVVIELMEGKPPYHFLDPMPAMFRIVQDDCPPIPEGASPIVKDFLYHCFQKDCNLRISAKKLLRHPWMVSARKQMTNGIEKEGGRDGGQANAAGQERRPLNNYNFDEAVLKVQEWNEALKCKSCSFSQKCPSAKLILQSQHRHDLPSIRIDPEKPQKPFLNPPPPMLLIYLGHPFFPHLILSHLSLPHRRVQDGKRVQLQM
jgi:serine/threonine protein kinase